jgi:hypothetical protein
LFLPVGRHHLAVLRVVLAVGPGEGVDLQRQAEAAGGGLDGAQAFGQDFIADAVAGDGCDFVNVGHGERPEKGRGKNAPRRAIGRVAGNGSHGRRAYSPSTMIHRVK